eukprot:CAMPEP_0175153728 /NCGR_PEP_ID=MMETSP0087-20121206/19914_1 /TAXON_ID=136419 /ORGANISM="Unknown Unknown, Strain D1" /LENGTH=482 /DNA_ID=CAMNT_0016440471 /DNA_START=33 /DNA_END=1478 /DNA_ORIENTATION=-
MSGLSANSGTFVPRGEQRVKPRFQEFVPRSEQILIDAVNANEFVPSNEEGYQQQFNNEAPAYIDPLPPQHNHAHGPMLPQPQMFGGGRSVSHPPAVFGGAPPPFMQQQSYPGAGPPAHFPSVPVQVEPVLFPRWRRDKSVFMAEQYRQVLDLKNKLLVSRLAPDDPRTHMLPMALKSNMYFAVTPLPRPPTADTDPTARPHEAYKVTSSADGCCYFVKRLVGCRAAAPFATAVLAPWSKLEVHPNTPHAHLVAVRDVFEASEFADGAPSLCVVYDYHPASASLKQRYFSVPGGWTLSGEVVWSFACQLASALHRIHSHHLAFRRLDLDHILIDNQRLRLSGAGVSDVLLSPCSGEALRTAQEQDLVQLGAVLLSLASSVELPPDTTAAEREPYMAAAAQKLGPDFGRLLGMLFASAPTTIFDVTAMISHRFMVESCNAHSHIDFLEKQLAAATQNGRLFRLLVTLGFVLDKEGSSSSNSSNS